MVHFKKNASQLTQELKLLLDALAQAHENLWIEKECYRALLVNTKEVSEFELNLLVESSQADPKVARSTHAMYSAIWEKLNETAMKVLFEADSSDLGEAERPN